jgi:hypothetical protein
MHHIATGLANNQIESLLPPLPFSAALAVAGLGLDERAGDAAGLDGLKNLLARLLSRSGELRGRVLMQRTLEVVSRLQAGAALTRPQVALERQRAVARTIRRLRAQRAALVAEWALRLRCVLPQLSSELARLLRNDDSADRYVADRVSSVVGDELFLLVSAALPPPMLATLSEPELRSRLNALARGTSLGMHGLTRRTESDLAARVAALAHQEVLLVFQEALAAGGARNEPERKADGTDFACPTGASALWRLMPLARALKAESWNQTRTRSDNVVRKVSKAEH